MEIKITVESLIDHARANSGLSFGELAAQLDRNQTRISEWRKGKAKPDASEIAFFAEKAGFPILETVAELEAELHPKYAHIWKNAVSNMRNNQG